MSLLNCLPCFCNQINAEWNERFFRSTAANPWESTQNSFFNNSNSESSISVSWFANCSFLNTSRVVFETWYPECAFDTSEIQQNHLRPESKSVTPGGPPPRKRASSQARRILDGVPSKTSYLRRFQARVSAAIWIASSLHAPKSRLKSQQKSPLKSQQKKPM